MPRATLDPTNVLSSERWPYECYEISSTNHADASLPAHDTGRLDSDGLDVIELEPTPIAPLPVLEPPLTHRPLDGLAEMLRASSLGQVRF